MSKVICLNASGALKGKNIRRAPTGIAEWSLNADVCNKIEQILNMYNVDIIRLDDVTGESNISISERVNKAKASKASAVISINHNLIGDGSFEYGDENSALINVHTSYEAVEREMALGANILETIRSASDFEIGQVSKSRLALCNYSPFTGDRCLKISVTGGCMNNTISYTYITSEVGKLMYARAVANSLIYILGLSKKSFSTRAAQTVTYHVRKAFNNIASEKLRTGQLSDAVTICNEEIGYSVYNSSGKLIHKSTYGKTAVRRKPIYSKAKVISVSGLVLRKERDGMSEALYSTRCGDIVTVLDREGDYWKVLIIVNQENLIGYLYHNFLQLI